MAEGRKPILGFPNHLDSSFTGSGYSAVKLSGGGWQASRPLTNLRDPLFSKAARSSSAAVADTFINVDLGVARDIKLLAIPQHNISRSGTVRIRASNTIGFSGLTASGVNALNATSINVAASSNLTVNEGDGFSIAGDSQLYQATARLGLGQNLHASSEDLSDGSAWVLSGLTLTSDAIDGPDASYKADYLGETAAGSGTRSIRHSSVTITSGATLCWKFDIYTGGVEYFQVAVVNDAFTNGVLVQLDLTGDGEVNSYSTNGAGVYVNCTVTKNAQGWYTVAVIGQINGGVTSCKCQLNAKNSNGGTTYTATGTDGFYFTRSHLAEGSTVPKYVYTGASAASTTGSLSIERVGDSGTGLAAATTGGEAITCHAGDFAESLLTTAATDVWEVIYPWGTLYYGHPSLADGKASAEDAAKRRIPFVWINSADGVIVARYWRVDITDTANSDSYVSLARLFMCPGWEPTKGVRYGAQFGRFSNTTLVSSAGGAEIENEQPGGRQFVIGIDNIPEDEALTYGGDLLEDADLGKQIFFVFDKSDTIHKHRRSFTARLTRLDPATVPTFERMDMVFDLKEVVA